MTKKFWTKSLFLQGILALLIAMMSAACIEVAGEEPYEPSRPEDTIEVSENHRQVVVRDYASGQPVLLFNFEQTRTEENGLTKDASTTLFIQNTTTVPLSFTYQVDVYSDLGYYQWSHSGYVANLPPGAGTDEGIVSHNKMNLKFAVFQVYAQ